MSGNKHNGATINTNYDESNSLYMKLDLLWIKLDERHSSLGAAYRYFDKNYNNRVSFGEF